MNTTGISVLKVRLAASRLLFVESDLTAVPSYASLQWMQEAKDQVRRCYDKHLALFSMHSLEISMRPPYNRT